MKKNIINVRWDTKKDGKKNYKVDLNNISNMPKELVISIVEFIDKKCCWYGFKLKLSPWAVEDLKGDLFVKTIELLPKYINKTSSLQTYLNTCFNNFFKDICRVGQRSLQEKYGVNQLYDYTGIFMENIADEEDNSDIE